MALPPKDISILSVDDFSTMRRIVINALEELGYTAIDEADNGVSALARMRIKSYGLVISDWNMPEKSGIELLRSVRADPELEKTPFLMVDDEVDRRRIIEAVKAGADHYLLKPFTFLGLRDKISAIF